MALAGRQHGVVARWQLLELGMTPRGIKHRTARGRLHPVFKNVYAVGRPQITREGKWMAAVLAVGPGAALSHFSAMAHLGFGEEGDEVEVSTFVDRRRNGIRVYRRSTEIAITEHDRIPVTTGAQTLLDVATRLSVRALERAINEADKLDLIKWDELMNFAAQSSAPGAKRLRDAVSEQTQVLTDSELERLFLPIARRAGLSTPRTQQLLSGYRVDFYWPELRLVVETDGLRYHRTPLTQARDARRDQVHLAAGRTPLRFTHAQVASRPDEVEATLRDVARRLKTLPAA
jgi:very-short-patch-repair endonuclease